MTEPSAYHQAFKAQVGHDFIACAHCGATNIDGASPYLVSKPDGRYECAVCSHCGPPVKLEPK